MVTFASRLGGIHRCGAVASKDILSMSDDGQVSAVDATAMQAPWTALATGGIVTEMIDGHPFGHLAEGVHVCSLPWPSRIGSETGVTIRLNATLPEPAVIIAAFRDMRPEAHLGADARSSHMGTV